MGFSPDLLAAAWLAAGIACSDGSLMEPERPHIVVILVDDMGFSDVGAYGSEIPTPNLDALAANGLRFTRFYNAGRCAPSRASLLTGLYSHQAGIGHMLEDWGTPGYRGQLSDQCVTLAEVLGSAGYSTSMAGKWHAGNFSSTVLPWTRGFDRSLLSSGGVYFPGGNGRMYLNGERIDHDDPRLPKKWYGTDLWTEFGIRFIDDALEAEKPFFLYLAHIAPHFPLQAPSEDIARFKGKYMAGWENVSGARHARQQAGGLVSPQWRAESRPTGIPAWESLPLSERDRYDSMMAVYAAVVSRLDRSVGTLVEALKQRGVFENTLILFMSDNGGCAESGPHTNWKPDPHGQTKGDPTKADSAWFCGQGWAHVQNTPFRWYKHYNHEGGIASPFIAHWPVGIKRSGWVHDPAHLIDIMPTLADVASAAYPETFKGQAIRPMEGVSLRPLFQGSEPLPDRPLFWEHEHNAAVLVGDMKLVRLGRKGAWELYDMQADRTEQNDLAGQMPGKAMALAGKWEEWAGRANVFPKKR